MTSAVEAQSAPEVSFDVVSVLAAESAKETEAKMEEHEPKDLALIALLDALTEAFCSGIGPKTSLVNFVQARVADGADRAVAHAEAIEIFRNVSKVLSRYERQAVSSN